MMLIKQTAKPLTKSSSKSTNKSHSNSHHLHFPLGARSTGLDGTGATCSPADGGMPSTGFAAIRLHYNTTVTQAFVSNYFKHLITDRTYNTFSSRHMPHIQVAVWRIGSDVGRINEVTLCRARLVLGWVTVSGFNSCCGKFISV